MIYPVAHLHWQVIRFVLRAESQGKTPLGLELRLLPTRRTKDGSFLDYLVAEGLLVPVGKPDPPGGKDTPAPFRTRYKLTELGRYAAEHGEYERAFTPADRPAKGAAGEMLADREARKPGRKYAKR